MRNLLFNGMRLLLVSLSLNSFAQVPVANFSITPNPVCAGQLVQITDLSTGTPVSWSYTLNTGGPAGPVVSTAQNPTVTYNQPGTHTISLIATNASGSSPRVVQTITVVAAPNAQINPANLNTCIGGNPQTITVLTGGGPGGTNTYSWSTGATTTSISVSPSVTTTYSCVISNSAGCSVVRTATVTITQPTLTVVSIPASICPGSSCTLTATGQGPNPSTYTWSTGATTRTISTNIPAVYTASYTNSNGCSGTFSYNLGTSTTLSLTAHADPSVVCLGNSSHLSVIGATSYTWSTGSNIATATVTPTGNTTYTVDGQFGTCSGVTTVVVNVSHTPTITISSSSPSICAGSSATINASGATTYTWTQGGGNSQSIVVSPSINTTYLVGGTNPGCPLKTASVVISVSPDPILSITSSSNVSCAGEEIALAANGAVNYTWSSGGNAAVVLVTPTITTTYTVTGTNSSNCSAMASITQSVNTCTGINKQEIQNVSLLLFPNPTNGSFVIRSESDITLNIVAQSGQLVKTLSLSQMNDYSANVSDLAAGIYFVTGKGSEGFVSQKIIVLK